MKNPKDNKNRKTSSIQQTGSKAKLSVVPKDKLTTAVTRKTELQSNASDNNLTHNIATVGSINTVTTTNNANVVNASVEREEEIGGCLNTFSEKDEKEEMKFNNDDNKEKEKDKDGEKDRERSKERDSETIVAAMSNTEMKVIPVKTLSADMKDDDPLRAGNSTISPKRGSTAEEKKYEEKEKKPFVPPDVGGTERIRVIGRFRPLNAYETVKFY